MNNGKWAALAAAASLLLAIHVAHAQSFPARPVHIVNPYAAGGSGDIVARLLADNLAQQWGVPVVVEHRPGAGGLVGTLHVQRAPGDGYTLLLASPSFVMSPMLRAEARYDPVRDFVPVTRMITSPLVVAVNASSAARSLTGLIAPAGTPREVVQRIAAGVRHALDSPGVREKLLDNGLFPVESSPEEFAAFLTAQGPRIEKVIRRAGIKVD